MADVTVTSFKHRSAGSGEGFGEYYGVATWPAGATSATLPVPLKVIDLATFNHVGTVAATDGQPAVTDTMIQGKIIRPASTGKLTLARPAATTSAPSFHFYLRGV